MDLFIDKTLHKAYNKSIKNIYEIDYFYIKNSRDNSLQFKNLYKLTLQKLRYEEFNKTEKFNTSDSRDMWKIYDHWIDVIKNDVTLDSQDKLIE